MSVTDLIVAGLELMLLGMGIVFVFLTALVFILNGMSRVARALDKSPAAVAGPAVVRSASTPEEDDVVAVISAAVAQYRARHKA